jgi:hypothetical protein
VVALLLGNLINVVYIIYCLDLDPILKEKDARRTDRAQQLFRLERGAGVRALRALLLAHAVHDFDLGYVQGMSDLAATALWVATRAKAAAAGGGGRVGGLGKEARAAAEAEAFWLFSAVVERFRGNFTAECRCTSSILATFTHCFDF